MNEVNFYELFKKIKLAKEYLEFNDIIRFLKNINY